MTIKIKRIYEKPDKTDGYRVLVDRLWPRGVSKETANLNEWLKDVAPSPELRNWFGHKPEQFKEFKSRYQSELDNNQAFKKLKDIIKLHDSVTLLYAARDPYVNHAKVLLEYLTRK